MTTAIAMPYAAESGHWYTLNGEPCYTVKAKNGNDRATTLADARKLNLVPSVTSIIRLAAAPGLEVWKRRQLALACLTLPRIEGESEDSFLARAEKDAQEEGKAAAERGTQLHAAIEQHFLGQGYVGEWSPWITAVVAELTAKCGRQEWYAEKSFAHALGFGGKVDLHNDRWVIDIKTKDGEPDKKLYDEHVMQLAAYDHGVSMSGLKGAILFVQRERPEATLLQATEEEMSRGWEMFKCLLEFHKVKTGHRP